MVNEMGMYESLSMEIFKDEQGNIVMYNGTTILTGVYKTMKSGKWSRWTSKDAIDFEIINERWENRRSQWYSTLDWLNYSEQTIHLSSTSIL